MYFIIVGADKCGTCAMTFHLNKHHEINCKELELNYFSKNEKYNNYNLKKYEEILKKDINIQKFYKFYEKNTNPDKDLHELYFEFITNETNNLSSKNICGEKSVSYMFLSKSIDRIYNDYPDMKIIISLREPVNRVYSSYNSFFKYMNIDFSFIDLVKNQEKLPEIIDCDKFMSNYSNFRKQSLEYTLQRGFYINYIEYIYSKFPKENIYICIQEEFLKNPLEEYNKLYKFLGAKELTQEEFKFDTSINKGKYKEPISDEDFKYTYNIYKEYNEKMYKFLGRRIESWDEIYKSYGII